MKEIPINLESYKRIKKAYNKAIKENKEVFLYDDSAMLVKYAYYLIGYMETILKIKK